jgi:hypothetical protein
MRSVMSVSYQKKIRASIKLAENASSISIRDQKHNNCHGRDAENKTRSENIILWDLGY